MRPPEFTGGNGVREPVDVSGYEASMRPPEFTGGNYQTVYNSFGRYLCFNEAAGIHRRKRRRGSDRRRPGTGFNEAAGIHRRKPRSSRRPAHRLPGFNEAAGIHRRKQGQQGGQDLSVMWASMRPPEFTGGNLCVMLIM